MEVVDSWSVVECLNCLDSWHLWLWYKVGVTCLAVAALEFLLAFGSAAYEVLSNHRSLVAWLIVALPLPVGMWHHFALERARRVGAAQRQLPVTP
jgi:hypothetical protein